MRRRKVEMALIAIGLILTILARDYAVNQRLAMGLTPSWGGELFIIPLIMVAYFTFKADWSVE